MSTGRSGGSWQSLTLAAVDEMRTCDALFFRRLAGAGVKERLHVLLVAQATSAGYIMQCGLML